MATIFDSKSVLLLASGTNKAGAVAAAVEDDVSESMPASMLRSHTKYAYIMAHYAKDNKA